MDSATYGCEAKDLQQYTLISVYIYAYYLNKRLSLYNINANNKCSKVDIYTFKSYWNSATHGCEIEDIQNLLAIPNLPSIPVNARPCV